MKNFIFISPNFPTNYWKFCAELKKKYRSEIAKCRPVVAMAGDLLQEMVEEELRRTGDPERAQGA